jgi:hypothetical protein
MIDLIERKACDDCLKQHGTISLIYLKRKLRCTLDHAEKIAKGYHALQLSEQWGKVLEEMKTLSEKQSPPINNYKPTP